MRGVVLLDLDETLVVEEPSAVAAFSATAQFAASQCSVDPQALATAARRCARELWYAAPTHDYCSRIGISSWEGLWCRFEGQEPEVRALREWSPIFRRESWRLSLAEQGVDDATLGQELGERFGAERRARHQVFDDAEPALSALRESHALILVTNGAACLQREKLTASGLADYFDRVIVSADVGVGKPDATIFNHALDTLGADRGDAVMVGDSLARDVEGAVSVGIRGIWLNRDGVPCSAGRTDITEISTLRQLPALLRAPARDRSSPDEGSNSQRRKPE